MNDRTINYLFARIELPPTKREKPDYVFILWNPVCSFELDKDLDDGIVKVIDERLYHPDLFKDSEEANAVFSAIMYKLMEMENNVVLMEFNVPLAKGLAAAAKEFYERYGSRWLCLSFFHSDEDTLKLPKTGGDQYADVLDQKLDWVLAMTEVPFVKKVEIPLDAVITAEDLKGWFKEYLVD
jgi:hypothetical protein